MVFEPRRDKRKFFYHLCLIQTQILPPIEELLYQVKTLHIQISSSSLSSVTRFGEISSLSILY